MVQQKAKRANLVSVPNTPTSSRSPRNSERPKSKTKMYATRFPQGENVRRDFIRWIEANLVNGQTQVLTIRKAAEPGLLLDATISNRTATTVPTRTH